MKAKLPIALAAAILLLMPNVNFGQAPDLGTTSTYALFTAVGAFNNIGATTTVTGDVGTNVGAFNAFPPGILVGQINVANSASAQAATDVDVAYSALDGITTCIVIGTTLGGGQILTPDVYCLGAASTLNGDLILDGEGDPSSLFIIKINGAMATTVNSRVVLKNSASICNVYWQVNGQVDLGNNSLFQGTILANGAIHLLDAATLLGRGLSRQGAISLQNNIVSSAMVTTASTITANGPVTFCPGGSVILSGNSGGTWSNGETTPSITVTTGGDYFIDNANGCGPAVTSNHIIVTVNEGISCTLTGNDSFCVGESTELCVPASDASTYLWSTGATTNCITISEEGAYSVTITNADGCSSTCSKTVTVKPAASTIVASGPTTFCSGGSVVLSGNTAGTWSNGETTPSITVTTAGDYFLENENACGNGTSNHIIVAVNPLSCSITGNSSICCVGKSTELCVPASDGSSFLWSTGATTNCISISAAGEYSITVTNADGCESTCTKTVTVPEAPSCDITGRSTICEGGSTSLCAPSGAGYTYLWSTGATSRCISANAAGIYSLTVTKDRQSSICSQTVTVTPPPSCIIEGSSTFFEGESTQLCAPSSDTSTYLWSTGATTSCITVSEEGPYSVTVTNADGCTSTCKKAVKVTDAPFCIIEGSSTLSDGQYQTRLCTPYGNGFTYSWSTGETTRCIMAKASGDFSVTVTKDGSSTICSKTITLTDLPDCTIWASSSTICEGGDGTQLCSPYRKDNTYLWSTGETTRCITVNTAGTFSSTVTNDAGSATCSRTIATASLTCNISGSNTICEGTTTSLCAPSGTGYTYLWSTGSTSSCITVDAAGTFSVEMTKDGCTSTCSKTVTVATPSSTISGGNTIAGDNTLCEGATTALCAPYGYGYTYLWSTGATSRCITADAAGTFNLTVTQKGCTSTSSKTIIQNPNPNCSITGNLFPMPGQTTTLCAAPGFSSYLWSTGETTSCITVDCSGVYTVVTEAMGCVGSCNVYVAYSSSDNTSFSDNTSLWTPSGNVSQADDISDAESNIIIAAYPNPFSSTAIVEFQNGKSDSHVVVELFSTTEGKVSTLFDSDVKSGGLYKVEVEAGGLKKGIYIYRITNGHQVINRKLILIK